MIPAIVITIVEKIPILTQNTVEKEVEAIPVEEATNVVHVVEAEIAVVAQEMKLTIDAIIKKIQ